MTRLLSARADSVSERNQAAKLSDALRLNAVAGPLAYLFVTVLMVQP